MEKTDPRLDTVLHTGPGLTKQSFAQECDINFIMRNVQKTGILPPSNNEALYADVSDIGDFQTAMDKITLGNRLFSSLPSKIRDRFNNNPGEYLAFLSNPENSAEGVALGLLAPPPPPAPPQGGDGGAALTTDKK